MIIDSVDKVYVQIKNFKILTFLHFIILEGTTVTNLEIERLELKERPLTKNLENLFLKFPVR